MCIRDSGYRQVQRIITMLLAFGEKNPGMTRVLIGDALVNEDEKLQLRINQLCDRIEMTLKQILKISVAVSGRKVMPEAQANLLICYAVSYTHLDVYKRQELYSRKLGLTVPRLY